MRRVFLGVLLVVLSACSSGAQWLGDGVHAVDGFWVQRETVCSQALCVEAIAAAQDAVAESGEGPISKVSNADWVRSWDDGHGGTVLGIRNASMGATWITLVVDLEDGTRRVVPVRCERQGSVGAGAKQASCVVDMAGSDYYRVGSEPWLNGS